MSLRFLIGASGAGKSTWLYRSVIERAQADPKGHFFLIVPDQFTMQTQQDLVMMHEKKGILNIDVLSFNRLAHRIFEELGGQDMPMLDDTGKSLIVRRVAAGLKDQMPLIGGNLGKTGYVHEVKSALSELMQYGIGLKELDELQAFARNRGQLCQKLKDLRVIYEGFLDFIRDRFLTTEETLEVLASLLPASHLLKDSVVAFDGFTGFTPVQEKVLRELMKLAKAVEVTVTMDGDADPKKGTQQELFFLSKKTIRRLEKLAEEAGCAIEEPVLLRPPVLPRFLRSPALAHLERHLFRYPFAVYPERTEEISVLEAPDQTEEVRRICVSIRRLIREKGYCYRDIAVICGDFASYAACMEREFKAYDIPVYMDQTRGISLNPFIEYIKSALQVRVQNYSFESVFHYLRSGLAGFSMQEADRLEIYVRFAGIRGRKKWETPFVSRMKEMTDPLAQLEELNGLRSRLVEQMQPLFESCKKTEEFARSLYWFIEKNQVQQKLKRYEEQFAAENDMVRQREYAQIYRLVMDLLDQVVALIGDEPVRIEEFAKILEAGFEEIQVGTIPQNVDRVVVGDIERTRLKPVKALFFAGVNDGYIPKSAGRGGILSDLDREFLAGSGRELAPTPRQQMYIQRLYLYLNMTKPSEKLVLSYARMNAEGKSMRPSFLIGQLLRMFAQVEIENPEKEPLLDRIQSLKDGRQYLARTLRSYADGKLTDPEEQTLFFLYRVYRQDAGYGRWAERMEDAAFFRHRQSRLDRAVAAALYGNTLIGSVSRLEQYAACAYAHFLRYGLNLSPQEEYEVKAADLGNLFHGVLEIFSEKLVENGYTWFDFPEEEGQRILREAVDAYTVAYRNTVLFDSARSAYTVTRLWRILSRTVKTLQYQLKKGSFVPEQFEVSFSVVQDLDAVNIALGEGERMRLKGRIDRLDVKEEEDRVFVKVVDYKSGSRDFSLAALYYGLQLQLVVYLNAGLEMAARRHPGKEAVPAAMLYYRVQDPYVEPGAQELTPEEVNARILQALRPTGVVSAQEGVAEGLDAGFTDRSDAAPLERKKDGSLSARSSVLSEEDFRAVSAFVEKKIRQTGRRILEGQIDCSPYVRGNESACDFCDFKKVCGFDRRLTGFSVRELENLGDLEALERIRREVKSGQ